MNFLKKILCAGLIGLFSMTVTTNVCAMDEDVKVDINDEESKPVFDVNKEIKKFRNAIIGRLDDSLLNLGNQFNRYFTLVRKEKGYQSAYKQYCEAVVSLLGAHECSQENIQNFFSATLNGFTDYFWKLSLSEDNRPAVRATLIAQITDSANPVLQTLDAFLDAKQFVTFCTTDNPLLKAKWSKLLQTLPGCVETVEKLFAQSELKEALAKLKVDLIAMLNRTTSPSEESKKYNASYYAKFAKRFRQGVRVLTPALIYSTFMITRTLCFRENPYEFPWHVRCLPILKKAVFYQGCWEVLKLADKKLGCWNFVKRNCLKCYSTIKKS